MSELSKLLGNAAAPHQIVHDGKAYNFALMDQVRKNAIEKQLYQQAREGVYVDRDHMDPDQYVARLDKIRLEYERGDFSFLGPRCTAVLQTPKGAMMLLGVITGESEDAIVALLAARPEEVNAVLTTVMSESFPKVKGAPNG